MTPAPRRATAGPSPPPPPRAALPPSPSPSDHESCTDQDSAYDRRHAPDRRRRPPQLQRSPERPPVELFNTPETRDDHDKDGRHGAHVAMGWDSNGDAAIPTTTTAAISQDVAPFLSKHIPSQYAPQGNPGNTHQHEPTSANPVPGNTRYCYRHRPDRKCRRPADEPTMEELQSSMDRLPEADQQAVTHVWSVFSAAPQSMRKMILQGILQQCCFPQLSFIAAQTRDMIRIDFLDALPPEISFKILSYLDSVSLCKAAQVSRQWRVLADDDVVWHKMCEQHIDRRCEKCGWGLPLLESKKVLQSQRAMALRRQKLDTQAITASTTRMNLNGKRPSSEPEEEEPSSVTKRPCPTTRNSEFCQTTRPWKDVYLQRHKVEANWRSGRCKTKVFRGHDDGIMCLQADDRILATGSYDSTIKIWDLQTGSEIRTLSGHSLGVRALQFDESKLISGSIDRTIKVWNYRTGECLNTLTGHTDGVVSLHFDGKTLVSGSMDHTIRVWDFEKKTSFVLAGHKDWVNCVRFDPDSGSIFSASDDNTVRLWDVESRSCIKEFKGHLGHVQQIVPLPEAVVDGPVLAPGTRKPPPATFVTASLDSTVKFWDTASGRCTKTLFGHVEGVWAIAADCLRVISGSQDSTLKVWDVKSGQCQRTITGHQGPITCVHLGDSMMVTGGEDGQARMYCFENCKKDSEDVRVVGSCGENIS